MIRPDVMEEVIVSCVIKHLSLMDALQSLVNYQYREDHTEEYDLLCKIMAETFKKINAMERQLQVSCWIPESHTFYSKEVMYEGAPQIHVSWLQKCEWLFFKKRVKIDLISIM